MELVQMLEKLNNYKPGTFVYMEWEKDITSAKAKKLGIKVVKKSSGLIRTEINYENLKSIQGIERGDKESWFEHYTKGILQNKRNPEKKYLQAFPIPGKKINTITEITTNNEKYSINDIESLYEMGWINKSSLVDIALLDTFTLDISRIKKFN